jgi:hypothetical protein
MASRASFMTAAAVVLLACPAISTMPSGMQDGGGVIARADSALARLVQMHREIKDIHPLLARLHPVAVLEGDTLFIFDCDSTGSSYRFQKKEPVPFPMQKGIRASFPLSSNDNKPTCVVSPDVFDSRGGLATMFHEFIHCSQALTVENSLKQTLHVANSAMEAKDYSWEINRRFPYGDSAFTRAYARFLLALGGGDSAALAQSGRDLRKRLTQDDFEYLVWVEWKEGFARCIENKIRKRYGLEPNLAGKDPPYDRVTFYYGGEKCIDYLALRNGGEIPDLRKLFAALFALCGGS